MPLPASYAVLAERRTRFLQRLDAYSDAQRVFRPAPDAWSPDDVAEHLYRVERGSQTQLRRALAAGEARPDLGPPDEAKLSGLEATFASGTRRTTMPAASAPYITPQGIGWPETRAAWTETAARWQQIDVSADLAGVGLTPHPVAGPLDADGTVRFLAVHILHHTHQIDRIEASEGWPVEEGGRGKEEGA